MSKNNISHGITSKIVDINSINTQPQLDVKDKSYHLSNHTSLDIINGKINNKVYKNDVQPQNGYSRLVDKACYGRLLATDDYLSMIESIIDNKSIDNISTSTNIEPTTTIHKILTIDKSSPFDFSNIGQSRKPIQCILDNDDDDTTCNNIQDADLIQLIQLNKRYHNRSDLIPTTKNYKNYEHFQNYSVGILKNNDTYDESKLDLLKNTSYHLKDIKDSRTIVNQKKITSTIPTHDPNGISYTSTSSSILGSNNLLISREKTTDSEFIPEIGRKRRKRQFMSSEGTFLLEYDVDNARFRYYCDILIKEIGKACRSKNSQKVILSNTKRKLMNNFTKNRRKAYVRSKKIEREFSARAKRVFKEVFNYGKKSAKAARSNKKKHEKELVEKQKQQQQYNEMKRQQRKLNYLITQTELFSHFMGVKNQQQNCSSNENDEELAKILSILDEDEDPSSLNIQPPNITEKDNSVANDNYDITKAKNLAIEVTRRAVEKQSLKLDQFQQHFLNHNNTTSTNTNKDIISVDDYFKRENKLFNGTLKSYQLKGVSWLAGLYDKGINGILADEMGLGKTVQTLSFFAYLSEIRNLWGPFLVISPSSTLHNWQQEFTRFIPEFCVLPYWGNSSDRKSLRTFWNAKKHLFQSRETAPFHVLITSYQLVIRDYQYFKRISWQYMVLDEAQAIKSVNSQRWRTLLSFNCRNRLLLTGTPMQNTMAELWALLHFIMPILFDSHDEFNEWFSKDIEGRVENKTTVDQTHLSRLHMVLKPFMLRRTKKEVEKELTEKIEIQLKCGLSIRQKMLYEILKKKLSNEEVLSHLEQNLGTAASAGNNTSILNNINQLMNLVVQFRKVCNHPDLFERRNLISPLHLKPLELSFPNSLLNNEFSLGLSKKLLQLFNIYSPENVTQQMFTSHSQFGSLYYSRIHPSIVNKLMSHIYHRIEYYIYQLEYYHKLLIYDGQHKQYDVVTNQLPTPSSNSPLLNLMLWPKFKLSAVRMFTNFDRLLHMAIFINNIECFQTFGISKIQPISKNGSTLINPIIESNGTNILESATTIDNNQHSYKIIETKHSYPDIIINASYKKVVTHPPQIRILSKRALTNSHSMSNTNRLYEKFIITGECNELSNRKIIKLNDWSYNPRNGFNAIYPSQGWSHIVRPDPSQLIGDSGKMLVLNSLLSRLKVEGHRVLIYSQMTKMIDILEVYLTRCRYKFVRLDGSSKMADRRETVADFQSNSDIFVFLLSTRAGGVGINLTAADTVIFYDSDWNPTVDQQAMDRAHRLGQTRQVTVYRLICDDTVEERILQRAQQKSMVQQMIISGKNKQESLKPKELMALLLGEEDIQQRLKSRKETSINGDKRKSRKRNTPSKSNSVKERKSTKSSTTHMKKTPTKIELSNVTTINNVQPNISITQSNNIPHAE